MEISGNKLMILGAGLMLLSIPMAINEYPNLHIIHIIHYYLGNYLPVPAGVIFLIGWFKSLYED